MEVVGTITEVRAAVGRARNSGRTIGLVPTMGALHVGHVSLIERCVEDGHFTIVSIFVNPTQFGPGEDFEKYPRPLDADLQICQEHEVDLVFAPAAADMYPSENLSWVNVEKMTSSLCGRSRPGHFRGVATVCAKLFNIAQPDVAYFGQKDAQQAVVIKKMAADLNFQMQIVVCPTIREADGLAVSSRNQYLSSRQRKDAACLYRALEKCKSLVRSGTTDSKTIIAEMTKTIEAVPSVDDIEYIEIVDAKSLEPLAAVTQKALVALAVRIGPARLIDNILLDAPDD
ncbi:MAG: pantoate--beta-alanine ligase [Sedimentisphaerales bacterium]|nr:pantoate--beta-alanine ligase [Sedimentisphaerales bacterium]